MLATTERVKALLNSGKSLMLAGEEQLLASLPKGRWIGGTIPYFMDADGGLSSRERVFVQELPEIASSCRVASYDTDNIANIARDSPENGYSILILPAFTEIHQQYALDAPSYDQLFFKVIAGWIAGVHLDDLDKKTPKVFSGETGEVLESRGIALHVQLPDEYRAQVGIVNIFEQGSGEEIQFPASGFNAAECSVNGERCNFAEYIQRKNIDPSCPLVADFCGAMINVSVRGVDAEKGRVAFYAPVFEGVSYRFAKPVSNYAAEFGRAIPKDVTNPVFGCNCVLNFLHGELEKRRTGSMVGPMTFGEIAYQLLNQTLVYVTFAKAE
jgi:hypothetical protein